MACARNGAQLIAALESAEFDLIVLSNGIESSEADDFALLRGVRQRCPDAPVVVFTDERDPGTLAAIQRAGAKGLVNMLDEACAFERVRDRGLSGAKNVISALIATCGQPVDPAPAVAEASPDYGNTRMHIKQFVGRT